MKLKLFAVAVFATILLLALTGCSKTQSETASAEMNSDVQQTEQQNSSDTSAVESSAVFKEETSESQSDTTVQDETPSTETDTETTDEAWKEAFEKRLLEEYEVTPERYEDLGNGIYQVYVKIGDKVVPYVTVDSATGDFHG